MNKRPIPDLFSRNVPGTYEILQNAVVGVAGCGGLGSNAAVALTRAGIGTLILADFDKVEASNLNRQYFFQSDIGIPKVQALSAHCKAINPDITIVGINQKLLPDDIGELFKNASILIEAFDKAESKSWLIEAWCKVYPKKPIICASGLSGFGNTTSLKVKNAGNIYIVGDQETDMTLGLCSARVAIAANMEANIAIELLVKQSEANNASDK